jgi:hypothetical protein
MLDYELAIDYMDMTNDMHVLTRTSDARPGFDATVGRYVIVGDEDAAPNVARIVAVDAGIVELEVLPGSVESHRHLLSPA